MIKLVKLVQTNERSPSQWEGFSDKGNPVYIRFRHGCLAVSIGKVGQKIRDAILIDPVFEEDVRDEKISWLTWEEVAAETSIELLEQNT